MLVSGPSGEHTLVAQRQLLHAVETLGSYTRAADSIGIDRSTVYAWLDADKRNGIDLESPPVGTFAHGLLRAKEIAAETILGHSYAHAVSEATDMPATINRIFHIKRWYPQYRDQLNIRSTNVNISAKIDLNKLSPEGRSFVLQRLQHRLLAEGTEGTDVAVGDEATE